MSAPLVSVVIPVLRDAVPLAMLLAQLQPDDRFEVVVASGGADLALDQIRQSWPSVLWTQGPPGRGRQMNAGAARATGRWLLFLHADVRLGEGWFDEISRVDGDHRDTVGGVVGGCFRLEIDSPRWQARLIERGVQWRVRWLGFAYGDQGLFVRRDLFQALGGYRQMPVMEDADLVRRLRYHGPLRRLVVGISVSARRWERDGWTRRTVSNLRILALYLAGRSPDRLVALYPTWQEPTSTVVKSEQSTDLSRDIP